MFRGIERSSWVELAALALLAPAVLAPAAGATPASVVPPAPVSETNIAWNNASGHAVVGTPTQRVNSTFGSGPANSALADGSSEAPVPSAVQQGVEQRLRDSLSPEMLQNFGLFIYVSKAEAGPWAQHMVVFQKAGDELLPLYDWPVSTGRETMEADAVGVQLPTTTPSGYYELDPKRMYESYHSTQWNESMPYAMFFNWKDHGVQTGLAIHAATDDAAGLLGMRASAGCVRLSLDNARTLFTLIRDNYKGSAPKFGIDKYTGTIMNNGLILHDAAGNVELAPGYSVLVYIDDYGGQNLEAEAY
jgi:lipoprotein-anchoring transpeptidase ErfK/SrfK